MALLTTMKGISLAYNKDMQEDKEGVFDALDTAKGCLALFEAMLSTMRFNKNRMEDSAKNGFTNATDAADYLVNTACLSGRSRYCGTSCPVLYRKEDCTG